MTEDITKEAELPKQEDSDNLEFDNTPLRNYPKIEKESIYDLTLHSLDVVDGQYGLQRRWGFAVDGYDPEEDGVLDYYSALSGRGKKNEQLANALGFEVDGPTTLKKSDLLGRKCKGIVTLEPSKKTGKKYAKIVKLIAA